MFRKSGALTVATCAAALCLAIHGTATSAADTYGLENGSVELQYAGPLAFGPDGVLFVGDPKAAAVFAIQTGDRSGSPEKANIHVDGLKSKLGELLGAGSQEIQVRDLAVNPRSGNVYLSVAAGRTQTLVKVDGKGELQPVALDNVAFARHDLSNAPADEETGEGRRRRNNRLASITDLAFVDGKLVISGLRAGDSPSTVRSVLFPFNDADEESALEIYHAAHGRSEDYAPIQTFVPFVVDGEPHLLAGFTCTPLVKIPLSGIGSQSKIQGTTVAELGNRNKPLDVISYRKDGKDYLLMANSARGMMKINTDDLAREKGLTKPVSGGGVAGQTFETLTDLDGVTQLDRLNDTHAIVLVETGADGAELKTVPLP